MTLKTYVFVRDLGGHSLNVNLCPLPNSDVGHVFHRQRVILTTFVSYLLGSLQSFKPSEGKGEYGTCCKRWLAQEGRLLIRFDSFELDTLVVINSSTSRTEAIQILFNMMPTKTTYLDERDALVISVLRPTSFVLSH
jgi:hypothetical protein